VKIKGSDLYIALKNLGKTNPNGIKLWYTGALSQ
jgi:hypothetical protein